MTDEHGLAVGHRVDRSTLAVFASIMLLSAVAEPALGHRSSPPGHRSTWWAPMSC
ncbi:MAG: hypothetical protein M0026_00185 [Nocardiopsaceae bacterium]|nr:hypothetical protein [Nocardiopsaceae bacterium]